MLRLTVTIAWACALVGAACGGRASREDAPVLVSAAVSLSTALEELSTQYTRETGAAVRFNFAGSNVLARQIVDGAAVDVFISADEAQMRIVELAGLVDPGTWVALLTNELAVVVRPDWTRPLHALSDLVQADVRRLAIGDPAAVPAGVYARQALERAGVWASLQSRIVPSVNVRAALAAVEEGNADAAIVYRTDVTAARHARLAFLVGTADAGRIVYPAAVIARAPHAVAARAWLAWLRGRAARQVFARYGFGVPSETR